MDCVEPLLALLVPEEELITQERASFSLSQLAGESVHSKTTIKVVIHPRPPPGMHTVEYSYKVQLDKHSAHSPLLKLLQSPDPDVQVSLAIRSSSFYTQVEFYLRETV